MFTNIFASKDDGLLHYDDIMTPIYNDYCDDTYVIKNTFLYVDHDKNDLCDSYFVDFAPTIIDEKDFAYVGSNKFSMLVDHDKNVFCDSYIVEFIHDATKSYYERGRYGFTYLNNIKFPLFMLKVSKLHLFCLPMPVVLCFNDLFSYRIPMHRKWCRLKCALYLLLDALFCASTLILMRSSLKF